jgi:hypothetical protein
MKDGWVWLILLLVGIVMVIVYTLLVRKIVSKKKQKEWLSDPMWLSLHVLSFFSIGVSYDMPWWTSLLAITAWEIMEKILSQWWPQYFDESIQKKVADIVFSTAAFTAGRYLVRRSCKQSVSKIPMHSFSESVLLTKRWELSLREF